ncbi:formylglycine-generating enzyme family protein [Thermomonas alba]|uniref:formylglycine-generating enzyme family protein n=1 Tax=Thermomonas alba TaxID=2888525 RepID=UPI0023D96321|nr:formylglycine-generating enzyme family protein [Thermomonas alba]
MVAASGCQPSPSASNASQQPERRREAIADARTSRAPAQVRIEGDDALAEVLSWSLPDVRIDDPARARAQARRALARGDLFETPGSAIPLLIALQKREPGNAQDARLLEKAQAALLAQAWIALAGGDDLASLRFAQRHGSVLRALWPEHPEVVRYLQAVDRAGRAFEEVEAGDRALRAGLLDIPEQGALAHYRKAQALWPALARVQQGLTAVQSRLIAQAQVLAGQGEFDAAYAMLARAQRVRDDAEAIARARAGIEAARADRIRRLGDEGMMALGDADLRFARERLAEILRIAAPGDPVSVALRERIDQVSRYGLFRPGQVFSDALADGSRGPMLVVVPYGEFMMGATPDDPDASPDEQPRHAVRFDRGFAMSRHEITVGEFRRFVQTTGYVTRATRRGHSIVYDGRSGNFLRASGVDWRSAYDGRPAADDMPVLHITARDAEAYAAWLSEQTGAHYRLPSEAEFEYALRAGGGGRYPWGDGPPAPGQANLAGSRDVSPQGRRWSNAFPGYGDGWWGPAPVGRFRANAFGLYDLDGNVSEWVADCWHKGYRRAPSNGAAWVNPGCRVRMYRGGGWSSAPLQARAAWRASGGVDITSARVGFRLVRQI